MSWLTDLRYSVRQYGRTPAATALIVVTLALGIGANATMTSALERLLLRGPEQVAKPDRLVRLLRAAPNAAGVDEVSARLNFAALQDFVAGSSTLESVAGYTSNELSFGVGERATRIRATMVTSAYFVALGAVPHLGRLLLPSDNPDAAYAVLGYEFWSSELGSDTGAIGRTVRIGSLDYVIVGVTAPAFRGIEQLPTQVWLPVTVAAERDLGLPISLDDRGSAWLALVGRMRDGVARADVEAQATAIWRDRHRLEGGRDAPRIVAASVILGLGPDRPREARLALWLGGVSLLVLLIACANVASLLLARSLSRQREIAVRLALGASRSRLARQMMTDGAVLALTGGVAALLVALVGSRIIGSALFPHQPWESMLGGRILLVTIVISLVAAVLVSLAPLWRATRPDLERALRSGDSIAGGRSGRTLLWLLGSQAALCMTLLVFAGLFAQSLRRVQALDLGMDADRALMARVELSGSLPRPALAAAWDEMRQRVRSLKGVSRVALTAHDPFAYGRAVPAHTPERSEEELWHREDVKNVPMEVIVDSGFFRALGTTSLRGRDFDSRDRLGSERVAILNEPLARILWPSGEPLGQCLLLSFNGGDCIKVVGVVGGFLRRSILHRDELAVYLPMAQSRGSLRPSGMVVQASDDASVVARRVRESLQQVSDDMPAVSVLPMRDVLRAQLRPWEVAASLLTTFGAVALLIALVGLYAVVNFSVAKAAREIAIRVALGGGAIHVLRVVSGRALVVVAGGMLIGVLVTFAVRHRVGALLFQTSPSDPLIIASVGLVLVVVSLAATSVPALRTLKSNPATALRSDQ